jgi:hypothetical protein
MHLIPVFGFHDGQCLKSLILPQLSPFLPSIGTAIRRLLIK